LLGRATARRIICQVVVALAQLVWRSSFLISTEFDDLARTSMSKVVGFEVVSAAQVARRGGKAKRLDDVRLSGVFSPTRRVSVGRSSAVVS
jgi:hypothetical protein